MNSDTNGSEQHDSKAPYGPFTTMRNFLEQLANSDTVPMRIDKSVTSGMSGGARSQLLNALRFFGLVVGSEDSVSQDLRELLRSGEDGRTRWAATQLRLRYQTALELSESGGTNEQLLEWFEREYGHRGTTAEKAARFFMQMSQYAGVELSSHFVLPRASARRPPRRRTPSSVQGGEGVPETTSTADRKSLDPAIEAWLKRLPGEHEDWTYDDRTAWTLAFDAMLDSIFPNSRQSGEA